MVSGLQKSQVFSEVAIPSNADFFCHFSFLSVVPSEESRGYPCEGEKKLVLFLSCALPETWGSLEADTRQT